MRKPVLIVIAGPNGSGKTSTTRLVIKHEWAEQCVYINPDEIAQSKFGDWNDVNAVRQAVEYCETWREQLLQEHKDFINDKSASKVQIFYFFYKIHTFFLHISNILCIFAAQNRSFAVFSSR